MNKDNLKSFGLWLFISFQYVDSGDTFFEFCQRFVLLFLIIYFFFYNNI